MRNKLPLAAFLAAALACAVQAFHYAPLLPQEMASHFGADGLPNGWMSRGIFLGFDLGLVALLTLALFSVSVRLGSLDAASINLPDKDYWMAPERRAETLGFLSGWFLWFGAATLLLLLDVFHQVFRYNLFLSKKLEHPVASLAVYVLFTAVWLAGFFRRLKRPR